MRLTGLRMSRSLKLGGETVEDNAIIGLFQRRDANAISFAKAKYDQYCTTISYRILHNREDAEECVNDAFLQAWNSIPPQQPKSLSAYLGAITRNLALNLWKRNHAAKRSADQIDLALTELTEVVGNSDTPEAQLESQAIIDALNRFLATQPEKYRNVFVRRYWHLVSISEIAGEYQMSESNVKQILFRVRRQLRTVLENEGLLP